MLLSVLPWGATEGLCSSSLGVPKLHTCDASCVPKLHACDAMCLTCAPATPDKVRSDRCALCRQHILMSWRLIMLCCAMQ